VAWVPALALPVCFFFFFVRHFRYNCDLLHNNLLVSHYYHHVTVASTISPQLGDLLHMRSQIAATY